VRAGRRGGGGLSQRLEFGL
jgi:hypothetical protein